MKTRTFYNSNPRFAEVKLFLNDLGEREAISVISRYGEKETETVYLYKKGKRRLAKRIEKEQNKTTEFLYPVFTGKPFEIRETFHPLIEGKRKDVSLTTYNGNWEETSFQWLEDVV